MKKIVALILTTTFIILTGCTSAGASDPSRIQRNAQDYIQKNYSDFSSGSFEGGATVKSEDNNVYEVTGKMQDNGGWEHDVSEEIQISPNGTQFTVCSLWIDGKSYISNSPKENSEGNSGDGSVSQSVDVSFTPQGYTFNLINTPVLYIVSVRNLSKVPIDGVIFKIKLSSNDADFSSNTGNVSKSSEGTYQWNTADKINPQESLNTTIDLSSEKIGNYKATLSLYDSDMKPYYDSKTGKQTTYELEFQTMTKRQLEQKGILFPPDSENTPAPIQNNSDNY